MQPKRIILEPSKCNDCRECETACSNHHFGLSDPALSRIRILRPGQGAGFFFPVLCFHCSDPPCLLVCPAEAIDRDDEKGVTLRRERCVGCKMCIAACPFGAIFFDGRRGRPLKCDLCGGSPECVRRCAPGALTFSAIGAMEMPHVNAFARNMAAVQGTKGGSRHR